MLAETMTNRFLTLSQQAELLISRGMKSKVGLSTEQLREAISEKLQHINYHRFSQYWNRMYIPATGVDGHTFEQETYWEDVVALYMFDRRLRNLLFDAIARIEISLRSCVAHQWALSTQCFTPYSRVAHFGLSREYTAKPEPDENGNVKWSPYEYMLRKAQENFDAAKKRGLVTGRRAKVADVSALPVWEFVEFCTFGAVDTLLSRGLKFRIRADIAQTYGFTSCDEFVSVIALIHDVRNACAHQGRIWNREWKTIRGNARVPKMYRPEWHLVWDAVKREWVCGQGDALVTDTKKTAVALTYCCLLLQKIAPNSGWKKRCRQFLTDEKNQAYIRDLGFHPEWASHPFWC